MVIPKIGWSCEKWGDRGLSCPCHDDPRDGMVLVEARGQKALASPPRWSQRWNSPGRSEGTEGSRVPTMVIPEIGWSWEKRGDRGLSHRPGEQQCQAGEVPSSLLAFSRCLPRLGPRASFACSPTKPPTHPSTAAQHPRGPTPGPLLHGRVWGGQPALARLAGRALLQRGERSLSWPRAGSVTFPFRPAL